MPIDERTGRQIIDAFFRALELKQWERSQKLLQILAELARQEPALISWHTFLSGVLARDRDLDWVKGERIFTALLETNLDLALHGRVLINLGITYRRQGRWHEAIKVYEQALAIFNQPNQAINRIKVWKNMAIVLEIGFSRGEFGPDALQQAVKCCQLALETLQVSENPNEDELWLEATTWNTLGVVYFSLADWPQATHCYDRFIAISHTLNDRHSIGMGSNNLGEVLQRQGPEKWPEARQAYLEALGIYREFSDQYEQIDVLSNLAFLSHEMGDLSTAFKYYQQALELIETLRARVTSEAGRAGYFATVADTYANAVLLCLESGNNEQAFNFVERACSRAFLDMLHASSPDLERAIEATPMTLAEVQTSLPTDTLLLEYFTTGLVEVRERRAQREQSPQRHRFPPAKTLIFAITRETLRVCDADLSPNDLRPNQLDDVVERHFLQPQIRRSLYNKLITPVEQLLHGRRRLYLIPHGPLHYIPFQALIALDGDTLLREAGPELVYAPSTTFLFRYGRAEPERAPKSCLTLGYAGAGAPRLRFAEEEARTIARLTGGQALTGPAPKKANLYRQAPAYRLLHFSCHGEFNSEEPLASALHLAPDETLTALDIFTHLRLRCDLVTLSACESGLSRIRRGDELIGLLRAFAYAGTPTLVATLWRVDERSTLILMEKFYQEVQNGVGFAEALKRSQLYLKNLTGREALAVLARALTTTLERLDPAMPPGASQSAPTTTDMAWQQAGAYLKGLATGGGNDASGSAIGEDDEAKIFADPFYWAPFVLVGEHGS